VEDSSVVFTEIVVVWHDPLKQFLVLGQSRQCSQKPTVSKIALVYVVARESFDFELGIRANLHWALPDDVSMAAFVAENVQRWLEIRIFEKSTRVQALLAKFIKII
jgi:hypothetical protein